MKHKASGEREKKYKQETPIKMLTEMKNIFEEHTPS